jgi:hypothetical protein
MKAMRLADSGATVVLVEENVPAPHELSAFLPYTSDTRRKK